VKDYIPGQYFGELSLLKQQLRAATVIADATPTKLLSLDGDSFRRLLGDLSSTLAERARKEYSNPQPAAQQVPPAVSEAFRTWDTSGGGKITKRRMVKAFKRLQPTFPDNELEALMHGFGAPIEDSGLMDYNAFVEFIFRPITAA